MMTQEQAAKYFIIGWIKGWSLQLYWFTVLEHPIGATFTEDTRFEKAYATYKWLPKDENIMLNKITCQRYIGDNMPSLSDKLWACQDNAARLKLFQIVLDYKGVGIVRRSEKVMKERHPAYQEKHRAKMFKISDDLTTEEMRRGSGHHWNVCK